jgi:hypothetical protein
MFEKHKHDHNCCAAGGLWSARSPDLTPPDLFFWKFVRERVYSNNAGSLEDLKYSFECTVAKLASKNFTKSHEVH